jgi:hypothetical protein
MVKVDAIVEMLKDALERRNSSEMFLLAGVIGKIFLEERLANKMSFFDIENLIRTTCESTKVVGPEGEQWPECDMEKVGPMIDKIRAAIGKPPCQDKPWKNGERYKFWGG